MAVEIATGLWRWTAPHPDWRSGAEPGSSSDWPQEVGSVLVLGEGEAVFVDPQLPEDPDPFWAWCDDAVGNRAVRILTTIRWHGRSREAVAGRYGGELVTSLQNLPSGVEAFRFKAAWETMFWLPDHRALIAGDLIIGADPGGVRLCPDGWLQYTDPPLDQAALRTLLRPLVALPIQRVLVSHGEPMLSHGAEAVRRILAEPGA